MIRVEDVARFLDVELVLGGDRPRQLDQPLEVGARDGVLRRRRLHDLEPLVLLERGLLGLRRHLRLGDLLLELLEIAARLVQLAELFLDRLELLAQDVLALVAAHLFLDLRVDLFADLEHLELPREELQHRAHARLQIEGLEHVLLLVDLDVQVRGDQIGELPRLGDAVDQRAGLFGELGHELDDPLGDVLQVHHQRVELDVGGGGIRHGLHARENERLLLLIFGDTDARDALQDDREVVLGELDDFENAGCAAHRVHVRFGRILGARVALREDADHRALLRDRFLDEAHALATTDVDRDDRPGEQHRVP